MPIFAQLQRGDSMTDFTVPPMPRFEMPILRTPTVRLDEGNPAKWMYERLVKKIVRFEEQLSQEEEIGGRFVTAPKEGAVHIEDMGYWGPDMLSFVGTDADGRPFELLQHYTQVSVFLCAVPKLKEEPRRIGFVLLGEIEKK
jgi:hypothetical protein